MVLNFRLLLGVSADGWRAGKILLLWPFSSPLMASMGSETGCPSGTHSPLSWRAQALQGHFHMITGHLHLHPHLLCTRGPDITNTLGSHAQQALGLLPILAHSPTETRLLRLTSTENVLAFLFIRGVLVHPWMSVILTFMRLPLCSLWQCVFVHWSSPLYGENLDFIADASPGAWLPRGAILNCLW